MNFQYENDRIFLNSESGQALAEITFPSVSRSVVNINHTFVDSSLRGRGVADKLVRAVVSELRERNLKAVATCSYAKKWFGEHQEYSDLLSKPE